LGDTLVKKEHIVLGALVVGAGLAYLFRDKIAQHVSQAVSPIRIWVDREEARPNQIVYVYASATPAEDVDVHVYQNGVRRAIFTIYLKSLNMNRVGFIPSRLCTSCVLTLQGFGRETGRRSNVVTIRVLR
jgi:hypothetical protein